MKRILVSAVVLSMLFAATAFAYEVVDVKNGGSIKGKIKASAKVDDLVLTIDKDVEFCGKSQPARMYILSPALEVKNVLVFIEEVQKGKAAPKTDITIDNNKCVFEPLVGVAYKGANFVIKNSDNILHNTNLGLLLKDKRSTVYNLALPTKDQVITKPIRRGGLHAIKCDAHAWMRAYLFVADHPYAAVTDASGSFEIKDLLPGKYKVTVWHEGFAEVTKEVEVTAGKASDLSVTLSKK
ncbi:MAG: carboxypeptidase regulatory-like domain-containing protein [Nitrospirae bacterium]|nr:carboxypeptidase regulatory-like domain-containing protein [Nitrospirota bacterium]